MRKRRCPFFKKDRKKKIYVCDNPYCDPPCIFPINKNTGLDMDVIDCKIQKYFEKYEKYRKELES